VNKEHLGRRAFSIIVSRHARIAIVLFVIAIVAFFARHAVGANGYMNQIVLWSLALFTFFLVYAFLVGWLVYTNYTFSLEDDAFRISQGVLSKKETAIPYRQIRDVNIERGISQQMYGVSTLVILTVGAEAAPAGSNLSESVAPIIQNIDRHRALEVQSELLKRANIQKISQS
jgi:uncharacterized membrane protein YdbT with pleckstrin-like domain